MCLTCLRRATTGAGHCTGGCWQGELLVVHGRACLHTLTGRACMESKRWYVDWCSPPLRSCKRDRKSSVYNINPVLLLQHDVKYDV